MIVDQTTELLKQPNGSEGLIRQAARLFESEGFAIDLADNARQYVVCEFRQTGNVKRSFTCFGFSDDTIGISPAPPFSKKSTQ